MTTIFTILYIVYMIIGMVLSLEIKESLWNGTLEKEYNLPEKLAVKLRNSKVIFPLIIIVFWAFFVIYELVRRIYKGEKL